MAALSSTPTLLTYATQPDMKTNLLLYFINKLMNK